MVHHLHITTSAGSTCWTSMRAEWRSVRVQWASEGASEQFNEWMNEWQLDELFCRFVKQFRLRNQDHTHARTHTRPCETPSSSSISHCSVFSLHFSPCRCQDTYILSPPNNGRAPVFISCHWCRYYLITCECPLRKIHVALVYMLGTLLIKNGVLSRNRLHMSIANIGKQVSIYGYMKTPTVVH
jgi:hypothetical protein